MSHTVVRVWDLPTRLFHGALAVAVVALVVTAKTGAMDWHVRLGYAVLALLVFRLVWGLVGGRWSRFSQFVYSPGRLVRYLRGQPHPHDGIGHSPLGALSVFALLGALAVQVLTGLMADDDIAFSGPLTRFVSRAVVGQATEYHTEIGQYVVIGLVALHVLAVGYYAVIQRRPLVGAMLLHGNREAPADAPSSRDDAATRLGAALLLAASGAFAWWVSTL